MNVFRAEWNILKKSLRILKRDRRLLHLLIPDAAASCIPPYLVLTGILFLINGNVPAAMTALLLAVLLTPPALILHVFLDAVFFSEMISGFGEEGILIKRGLLSAFIRRKALFRFAVHLLTHPWNCLSYGRVFAVPELICEEETEDPVVLLNRAESAVMHTWHSKGGYRGLLWLRLILTLPCLAGIVLACLHVPGGIPLFALAYWLPAALRHIAEPVYICALFCYAHSPGDSVGDFTRDELKNGFFSGLRRKL